MFFKLNRIVVFLKFFTCQQLSRPYYYHTLIDLTKQLIRDEDPYGEPSLTVTDIVFGRWQGIFRATQKAINSIARGLRECFACRSVQEGVSYYEKGFAWTFTGNARNTLSPRACGTNFGCCTEPSVCIVTEICVQINTGSLSRRVTGEPWCACPYETEK